jgi:UDP-3-O-[3-hydroxymyristoyl] glucosamine N-acyltransferase
MSNTHTTSSIAAAVGGRLVGRGDLAITDLSGLDEAGPGSLTFIRDAEFAGKWRGARAGAALVSAQIEVMGHDESSRALIYVADADLAMVKALALFERKPEAPPVGVHPTAVVDPTARIAPTARIGPFCSVGAGTVVGDHCTLMPRVTLGAEVAIGPGTMLHPGVVVYDRCTIGARSILHSNVNIGADGFGFRPDPSGRGLIKVPHIGTVTIGNGVEIGAGSCVDRGKFGATVIGDGAKIDNLVQIAHNCRIGRCVIICGNSGLAGSAVIGDGAIVGGAVGIVDNIQIGAGAKIGAKSGVMCDVPAGETWTGLPAAPHREQMRTWSAAKRMPDLFRAVRRLTKAVRDAGIRIDEDESEPRKSGGLGG